MSAEDSGSSNNLDTALKGLVRGGPVAVRVRGQSMEPLLAHGARVEISARRFYWPGDIVAFRAGDGQLVIHRLLGYRPRRWGLQLVTQGDAASSPDAAVPLVAILGRVSAGPGEVGKVPLWQRLVALRRFARLVVRRVGRALGPSVRSGSGDLRR